MESSTNATLPFEALPDCWRSALAGEFEKPYFKELADFVHEQRAEDDVFPSTENTFRALELTPLSEVRVLILGQDPYHDHNQAHGLSFSVPPGQRIPPSLRNIFKELEFDLGIKPAAHGCLDEWAQQGVLLLNTVLTVRAHAANSHRRRGWETFTDCVINCVNEQPHVAFVLWGKPAQKKKPLIDTRHLILEAPHPSPLSAHRGFFESRPFSQINTFLARHSSPSINWQLTNRESPDDAT